MKKNYNSALKKKFIEGMCRIPQFSKTMVQTRYFAKNELVFEMKRTSISCFIILVPSQQGRNEFTVELGWSLLGRPPELPGRPSGIPSLDYSEFSNREYVFRMADIIAGCDEWWHVRRSGIERMPNPFDFHQPICKGGLSISPNETADGMNPLMKDFISDFSLTILEDSLPISPDEADAVMEPLVKNCIDKIIEYGLPYFEKLTDYWQSKEKVNGQP